MTASPPILEIQNGKYKGRKVKLAPGETTIGRGEEARLRIASAEVSREHCILTPTAEGILVRDLESRNGTFIDGRPIEGERLLPPGSLLTVGPMTFLFVGKKKSVSSGGDVAVKIGVARDERLSDDDIASWLSNDDIPAAVAGSDTTIIKDAPSDAAANAAAPLTPVPVPRKREFKSVEEEAKDIIRRHFEKLAGGSGDAAPLSDDSAG